MTDRPEDVIRRARTRINQLARLGLMSLDDLEALADLVVVLLSERDRVKTRNVAMRDAHVARVELLMAQRDRAVGDSERHLRQRDTAIKQAEEFAALADRYREALEAAKVDLAQVAGNAWDLGPGGRLQAACDAIDRIEAALAAAVSEPAPPPALRSIAVIGDKSYDMVARVEVDPITLVPKATDPAAAVQGEGTGA